MTVKITNSKNSDIIAMDNITFISVGYFNILIYKDEDSHPFEYTLDEYSKIRIQEVTK